MKKKGIYIVIGLVVLTLIGYLNSEDYKNSKKEQTKSTQSEKSNANTGHFSNENVENEIRIIDLNKTYYDANGNKIVPKQNDVTYKVIEVLKHEKNKGRIRKANNEIINLLVEVSSLEKKYVEEISKKLKNEYSEYAPDNCLIELWDNKNAYKKYLEREVFIQKTFDELMEEFKRTRVPFAEKNKKMKEKWDRENYPFIADHNISYLDFSGKYIYFPLQDDYYKEVGGKNFKK